MGVPPRRVSEVGGQAGSILAWLSGGTGLVAAGVTVATADGKLPWFVAALFFPAIVVAVLSSVTLLRCRLASDLYQPPSVRESILHVENRYPQGRISVLAVWHNALTRLTTVSDRRARAIDDSLWYCAWAVALLVLPFVAAIWHAATK